MNITKTIGLNFQLFYHATLNPTGDRPCQIYPPDLHMLSPARTRTLCNQVLGRSPIVLRSSVRHSPLSNTYDKNTVA